MLKDNQTEKRGSGFLRDSASLTLMLALMDLVAPGASA